MITNPRRALLCSVVLWAVTGPAGADPALSTASPVDAPTLRSARIGTSITLRRDRAVLEAIVERIDEPAPDARVVVARRTGAPGHFVLALRDDVIAGYITGAGGTSHVRFTATGEVVHVTPAGAFSCEVTSPPPLHGPVRTAVDGDCAPQGAVHDILVLYNSGAVSLFGGETATLAEIDAVVALSNVALADSATTPRFRLALAWRLEENPTLAELTNFGDGVADEAHVLRDLVAADQVVMVYAGVSGVANGVQSLDPAEEANAFCRVGTEAFPYVFPHEIGHNMGCCHALGDGGGCPPEGGLLFPYSNGHRWFGDSGTQWHTIMAYSPGEYATRFSNPDVSFDGQPTGTVDANNALTMELSQELVANFRCAEDAVCGDLTDPAAVADCNDNGLPDGCDIGTGTSLDVNGNGIPDECDGAACPADVAGAGGMPDGNVDELDYELLLSNWGSPCSVCFADITGPAGVPDGNVDALDFLLLISQWGSPPNCAP